VNFSHRQHFNLLFSSWNVANILVGFLLNLDSTTSIDKMQPNTTFNIYITKRYFYIACLSDYMLGSLYRISWVRTPSYYKANCTIYSVFVFVNKISCKTRMSHLQVTNALRDSIHKYEYLKRKLYNCNVNIYLRRDLFDKNNDTVYFIVCFMIRTPDDGRNRGRNI
jgi:hypothetical protein